MKRTQTGSSERAGRAGTGCIKNAFLPMTHQEMKERRIEELDILIITGDAYVDHPSFGAAVIGRVLEAKGFLVGIIAQPDWRSADSLKILGRPRLFCGVTAGNLDSMLARYTASRLKRKSDEYSEGGAEMKRPLHAAVVYAQRARQAFPGLPVILGGIEASMRRVAHYDYWHDELRPSILCDSKADLLVYGMGERAVCEAARRLASGNRDLKGIRGTAYLLGALESKARPSGEECLLPSWEQCRDDRGALRTLTMKVEGEQNPWCGKRLVQHYGSRALIVEPPDFPLDEKEMDEIYGLPFLKAPHYSYKKEIPAFTMVKDSITVLRGCPGGCSFCSLGFHQGRFLSSRSIRSVIEEIGRLTASPYFKGTVSDLGGPTANLYACRNGISEHCRGCRRPGCLYPSLCPHFSIREDEILALYRKARAVEGVRHLFIGSGIRMDVGLRTPRYLRELFGHHVSGHLKVAPEHLERSVLKRMRKPPAEVFYKFMELFEKENSSTGKSQYLVPYFISGFPGCTARDMAEIVRFLAPRRWKLQQVQDYIPLPMTPAAAMFYSGLDYVTGEPIPVARGLAEKKAQKEQLLLAEKKNGKANKRANRPLD